MTQPKRDKLTCNNNKDTRWDRIRKRHCSNASANLKSDTVKKFIEIDYIGRQQQNILNGGTNGNINFDPVLVMNLRHEMFKKIPRKLPLATVAYGKNLQPCMEHNAAVEDHYIENQLKRFRKQLEKQTEKIKVPVKKIHSLLIDNTDIMTSLECTHKHIQDFYNTPIDALNEVHNLFEGELKKHLNLADDENRNNVTVNDFQNGYLQTDLEKNIFNVLNKEEHEDHINQTEYTNFKAENKESALDLMNEQRNELNLNNEIFKVEYECNKNAHAQRTPSPLESTDKVLQPLRLILEDPTAVHLRLLRFDDDINECQLKRQASISSNTSDGIDSVISDIAGEALKELQIEEEAKIIEIFEESNPKVIGVNLNGCSFHMGGQGHEDDLHIEQVKITNSKIFPDKVQYNSCSNNEQSKIINDHFQARTPNRLATLRKYFLKWIHYTTIEKIEREHIDSRADRVKKMNIFLDKIRIQKKRLKNCQNTGSDSVEDYRKNVPKVDTVENVKINKKYQNKIKVQQDIIDLQRLKLERQDRIIMELKLHKLSEETKEARQELKNELKSVIRSGDPKSKAKAKCLQIIGNLKDEEDENLNRLQGKSFLMPKFLQNMQERTLERGIRHEQARQRRLQQEAERDAQKLALEEAKRLEDEEAKRLRIEALKEKRRQERMAKIIKERERQKRVENQRKAQDFYKKILLNRIGMEGFKRLLQRKRDNLNKCEQLRQSLYKKTYFHAWFSLYRILKARRNQKADELYGKFLKRKHIQLWLQYIYEERSKYNVAVDYNEFKLIEIMFRKWWSYVKHMQMIEETKMKQAVSHHEWHLKWKVLDCWQRLPQILQLEKETEERRQRWRLKIWELLPDYKPNRDEFNYV